MEFPQFGDNGVRWKWFTMPNTDFQVHLYCPDTSEMVAVQKRYQNDMKKLQRHIARHWFDDFRNATMPGGALIENPSGEEGVNVRAAMLESLDVWVFVNARLASNAEWRTEGNAGSSGG